MQKSSSRMICRLVALIVLMALPLQAGRGQNAFPTVGTNYAAVGILLSSADEAKDCTRDDLLRAIQSDMKVSEVAKRLLKPLASSRDQACDALHITSEGEIKTIESLQAHAVACRLRPQDLDPVIADHRDTIRVLYRVCSSAQTRQGGVGANRLDDFSMPPFPE